MNKVGIRTHILLIRSSGYSKTCSTISRVSISKVDIWSPTISTRFTWNTVSPILTFYPSPFVTTRISTVLNFIISIYAHILLMCSCDITINGFNICCLKPLPSIFTICPCKVDIWGATIRTWFPRKTCRSITTLPFSPRISRRILTSCSIEILIDTNKLLTSVFFTKSSPTIRRVSISEMGVLGSSVVDVNNCDLTGCYNHTTTSLSFINLYGIRSFLFNINISYNK